MIIIIGLSVIGIAILIAAVLFKIGKALLQKAKDTQNKLLYGITVIICILFAIIASSCILFALYFMWNIVMFIHEFPG